MIQSHCILYRNDRAPDRPIIEDCYIFSYLTVRDGELAKLRDLVTRLNDLQLTTRFSPIPSVQLLVEASRADAMQAAMHCINAIEAFNGDTASPGIRQLSMSIQKPGLPQYLQVKTPVNDILADEPGFLEPGSGATALGIWPGIVVVESPLATSTVAMREDQLFRRRRTRGTGAEQRRYWYVLDIRP
jgi:hypothetical protein